MHQQQIEEILKHLEWNGERLARIRELLEKNEEKKERFFKISDRIINNLDWCVKLLAVILGMIATWHWLK